MLSPLSPVPDNHHLWLQQLVDLCGSISEIRKAWSRHIKLFPQFIRTNTSSKHIGTEKSSPNSFTEQIRNNSYVLVNQPSKGPSSGHMIQLSKVEQVHLPTLKDGNQPDQLSADPSLAVVNDKDVTGKQELSPEMKDLSGGNGSGNELLFDTAVQSKDDSSAPMELSDGPSQQRREDLPGPMDFSCDSIPQPGEDVSKSPGPVLDFKESLSPLSALKASQEHPSSEIINRDQDVELEQPPMPVSLENLSLVSGERESQDFVAMHSDDPESGEEIPSSSTGKSQDPINDGNGPVSCSSPATCLYSKSAQTHPGPVTAESSQLNDTVAVPESRSSKVPNQPAGYDQQQQPQQASSQEPRLRDSQGDSQIKQVLDKATVQCQSSTSQENIPSNQCWTVNNMPQQISMSGNHTQASSSPASYSQPSTAQHSVNNGKQFGPSPRQETLNQKSQHISLSENHAQMSSSHASFSQPNTPQHSGQSSQQTGALHHQEALYQTSQHYYQQQHLLHGQYQRHQLQMQQPYTSIQQQQMHPHPSQELYQQQQLIQQLSQQQTPLLQQQQYFQRSQSSQYQQQQYLLHQVQYLPQAHQLWQQQFQQQAQQMQPQEGQQTQQHYLQTQEQLEQYRQSQELAYQMQQHGYQLLLHQYQVHQQGYQCMQQQQQWQQQGHLQLHQHSHLQQQQYHHLEQQTDEDYNQTPQVPSLKLLILLNCYLMMVFSEKMEEENQYKIRYLGAWNI